MRYMLFGGEIYYALGGGNDYIGQSDSLQELKDYPSLDDCGWWHILDTESGVISCGSEEQAYGSPNSE